MQTKEILKQLLNPNVTKSVLTITPRCGTAKTRR